MASKIRILVSDFENSKTPKQMGRRNLSYQNAGERLKRKLKIRVKPGISFTKGTDYHMQGKIVGSIG